jgi:hypothetical protein
MYLKTNSQYHRDPLEARMLMIINGYSLKARMLQKTKRLQVWLLEKRAVIYCKPECYRKERV